MLNKDFKEFIASLNENAAEYLVVGGYAVAFHGHPCYTKDLDIWVRSTRQNAGRVVAALRQFGFGALDVKEGDFLEPDHFVQLGCPPNRIDLLTSLPGVEFDECYATRDVVDIDGVRVSFLDRSNLVKNKRVGGFRGRVQQGLRGS